MKNGIHFNKLTLVSAGQADEPQDGADDAASHHPYEPLLDRALADEAIHVQKTFVVFLSLSFACAAATIATGSYAAWLLRHQAARQALTDVNDILKSCQTRMSQLEAGLQRLPNRQA